MLVRISSKFKWGSLSKTASLLILSIEEEWGNFADLLRFLMLSSAKIEPLALLSHLSIFFRWHVDFYLRDIEMGELWKMGPCPFCAIIVLRSTLLGHFKRMCMRETGTHPAIFEYVPLVYLHQNAKNLSKKKSTLGWCCYSADQIICFFCATFVICCCSCQRVIGVPKSAKSWLAEYDDASSEATETHTAIRLSGAQRELTPGFALEFFFGSRSKKLQRWHTSHIKPWWNVVELYWCP